jgi:urease accessory protein
MLAAAMDAPAGWTAELGLAFERRGERTLLVERRHRGPLQVQRPFYPEGEGRPHVYLLHPPGGLVSGDELEIAVDVRAQAEGLITTPAATKVYRARPGGGRAQQRQTLTVGAGASLEWLPQETIVFSGAQVRLETRVVLANDARFLGWEIACLGRPAGDQGFVRGACEMRFELAREGRPLVVDRTRVEAGGPVHTAAWGLGGRPVSGLLLASPPPVDAGVLDAVRALAGELPAGDLASATLLDGALVCRYLGDSGERARAHFARVWSLLRPAVVGCAPSAPRIWST